MENRNILILTTIIAAALARLLPHPANVAPIAAPALFSGYRLKGLSRFVIPIAAMIVSDLVLGFHATMPFVYASFILTVCIGAVIRSQSPGSLALRSLTGSVLFFLITNFGVWATGTMYAHTAAGLIQAYTLGLPFFRNTLIGYLFFTYAVFYGYLLFANYHLVWDLSLLKKGKTESQSS